MNSIQPSIRQRPLGLTFMSRQGLCSLVCLPGCQVLHVPWAGGRIWLHKVTMMIVERLPQAEGPLEYPTRPWEGGRARSAPPRWEHDPITGLCNRSEPRSALCNSIRSAHCSQLEHQCHRDTKQCGSKRNFSSEWEGHSRFQHPQIMSTQVFLHGFVEGGEIW